MPELYVQQLYNGQPDISALDYHVLWAEPFNREL